MADSIYRKWVQILTWASPDDTSRNPFTLEREILCITGQWKSTGVEFTAAFHLHQELMQLGMMPSSVLRRERSVSGGPGGPAISWPRLSKWWPPDHLQRGNDPGKAWAEQCHVPRSPVSCKKPPVLSWYRSAVADDIGSEDLLRI